MWLIVQWCNSYRSNLRQSIHNQEYTDHVTQRKCKCSGRVKRRCSRQARAASTATVGVDRQCLLTLDLDRPLLLIFVEMARSRVVAHAFWGHGVELNPSTRSDSPLNVLRCSLHLYHETMALSDRKPSPIWKMYFFKYNHIGNWSPTCRAHSPRPPIRTLIICGCQKGEAVAVCMVSLDVPTFRIRACIPATYKTPSTLFLVEENSFVTC
jgi:hypothetical protein